MAAASRHHHRWTRRATALWVIGIASRGAKVTVGERITSIGELTRFLNRLVHCTGALGDRDFRWAAASFGAEEREPDPV
jgi:hypothetical protein